MQECGLPEEGRAAAIGAITKVIGAAKGFDLSLGDIPEALFCIDRIFEQLA
jgi:hypothetical protein